MTTTTRLPVTPRDERTPRCRWVGKWVLYAVLIGLAVFFLFPLVYMLASSFKPDDRVLEGDDLLHIGEVRPPHTRKRASS